MAANTWMMVNGRRIEVIRKFLVEMTFKDSDMQNEVKGILILVDQSLAEIGRLQREINMLKTENEALKSKK